MPWAIPVGNHLFLSHSLLLCPVTLGHQHQMLVLVSISHCPRTGNREQRDPVPPKACPICSLNQWRETQVRAILHTLLFSVGHCLPSEFGAVGVRRLIPRGSSLRMLMFLLCILSRRALILICVSDSHVTHVVLIWIQVFGSTDVVFLLFLLFCVLIIFFLH